MYRFVSQAMCLPPFWRVKRIILMSSLQPSAGSIAVQQVNG
ncbi:hypothetical protein Rleg4DRAFT_2301 [Rhizobium leguminosarum bv. trifolii WSM2297]|uniref:Uncharacterized protein n=1 Tax=Rhizobium leguminosarum bv. trifolii WSM2297 TaxID=754762 RepID=J0W4K5_RHILT|nr:hypothetical protein Rleg4DRAFT_2301 [Rhizobium leguminosarum bv. trifolii WSM2297]